MDISQHIYESGTFVMEAYIASLTSLPYDGR